MTIANLTGPSARAGSSIKATQGVENKPEGGKKTVDDVLAYLRELMPGWTISTTTADWSEGFRNIQIDREILQSMADDPGEMEKYKNLILDLDNTVPDLEKWAQDNPGKSLIFELSLDSKGNIINLSIIETLMGVEKRTSFDLPDGRSSWADLIREKLEALSQGQTEDAYGAKSWIA